VNDDQVLKEFRSLAVLLSNPKGVKKIVNKISNWLSLNITILIQYFGVQDSIIRNHEGRLILNIGSGDEFPEECINTDLFPTLGEIFKIFTKNKKVRCDYFLNILYKDKSLVGKVDAILFSHVLEHVPPHLSLTVLWNLRDFLKPGGTLRISVPCLNAYDKKPMPSNQNIVTPILAKNSLVYRWNHKFMYDQRLLTILLESVGFTDVQTTACERDEMGEFDVTRRKEETIYLICKSR